MTDEQKAAMAWLEEDRSRLSGHHVHVAAIKAMLAEPRLPAEPSDEIISVLMDRGEVTRSTGERRYRALYAHLTKPQTKTVLVWRVEYCRKSGGENYWSPLIQGAFLSRNSADLEACRLAHFSGYACIHVTGPHKQEIPT